MEIKHFFFENYNRNYNRFEGQVFDQVWPDRKKGFFCTIHQWVECADHSSLDLYRFLKLGGKAYVADAMLANYCVMEGPLCLKDYMASVKVVTLENFRELCTGFKHDWEDNYEACNTQQVCSPYLPEFILFPTNFRTQRMISRAITIHRKRGV